ncbi:Predicted arabinose efflux permease, MFS family [Rhizobiales bacterium GAS191]|nr:Predicted arabinose efflux permease, MFS family [Rhizobiales bacterium GAS191]
MAVRETVSSSLLPDGHVGAPRTGWLQFRPWAVVLLLMLIGGFNYLDRVLPSILAEPIRRELALSDTSLGLINGVAFLLVYACATIPIARLSDGGRYNLVLSVCLFFWSAMTLAGGLVTAGWQFAVSRMGVAVGEAGGLPAAHAFITRAFPPERKAAPLAVFSLGLPLGSLAGYGLGGVMGQNLGWRWTCILMGGMGMILAAFTYLALGRGPKATDRLAEAQPPIKILPQLRNRSLIVVLAGASLVTLGGYAAAAFTPAFLMRSHGLSIGEAGLKFGVTASIGGAVALLVTAWLADRLSARDPRWLLGVTIIMILLGLPISIASFRVTDPNLAVLMVSVNYIIPVAHLPPVVSALHRLCPLGFRARASALLLVGNGTLGSLGPLIAGAISDALKPQYGEQALSHALLIVIPTAYALAVLCLLAATRSYRDDMVEEAS